MDCLEVQKDASCNFIGIPYNAVWNYAHMLEVFLNSFGHILDIHCLRMYNLRNRNETVGFCSKGFSGSSSALTCSVSSFLRQLLLPSTPKSQFSELLEWEFFQIGVLVCHIVEKLLIHGTLSSYLTPWGWACLLFYFCSQLAVSSLLNF